jgi:NitT/TauT family transport system permease protein
VTLLLVAWETAGHYFPAAILPSFTETLSALAWLVQRESFSRHLQLTASRGALGFTMAMTLGIILGLLMGRSRLLNWLLNPVMAISTTVPPIFWVAVMIIWFGLGNLPPILVIVTTATPLVAVNMAQGMANIPTELQEMAHAFQVGRWTLLRDLYLPAISNYLFAAALVAVRFSWRTVVMAEFVGSTAGLGNRLAWARQNLEMDLAFAYMLVILIMGMSIEYFVLRPAQRRWGWQMGRFRMRGQNAAIFSTSATPQQSPL